MRLSSPAFSAGQPIPPRFTCRSKDLSPPLEVADVPVGAKALALIVDDPDAPVGLWTHWTAWDLPVTATKLEEGVDLREVGGVEGTATDGNVGYHGPCPPSGTHRYFFRVYALDAKLGLPRGAAVADVRSAVKAHTLAVAELMGTFTRSP